MTIEKRNLIAYRKVDSENKKLCFVFLHGLGGTKAYWDPLFDALSEFGAIYYLDLLGFGDSEKPNIEYSLEDHTSAIATFLNETLQSKKIVLIGHSMGAVIALNVLYSYKGFISKTFLLSLPLFRNEKDAKTFIKKSRSLAFLYLNTLSGRIACSVVCRVRPFAKKVIPFFYPHIPRRVIEGAMDHTKQSYFNTLTNIVFKPGILNIPDKNVILIHGVGDRTSPFDRIKKYIKKTNIPLIAIQNAGHDLPLTHAKEVVSKMKVHLKDL